ncbi:cobalt-precorrin-5B (C(1))-methyltransferase [Tumebacillus sp. ITR2]|uniref:Cobalt-precorrin-5B C(1)-methyltransferase n=1 Tax=Tumebacillus amylolyticus TaxID=2801339 RepID=A0ABS1J6C3_9BACL|nr:cobalt-precorrin-5B (C(1))-methyltransferase [Tumebacillus amylolyticus]MBL0385811.1 cobalt-precorrin-5B (C(1))-methyltransferase [Tumebacillus amylolyticus]
MKDPEKDPSQMRRGYTTGANATAATKAALLALITQEPVLSVEILLPIGERIEFQMVSCGVEEQRVVCGVIKDAGDDPDATHRALILAEVSWADGHGEIDLDGGIGVGRVTKPGLPVPVGEAAINPVPRRMIRKVAADLLNEYGITRSVRIVISVPQGVEIAKKTLNERLGIVGGISILGTKGIVVPFSTAAYQASVVQAIKVARASGCDHLVLTTGGSSEKYAMKLYPELPQEAFIQMGDFVGFSLRHAKRQGAAHISLVGMMGKFSKIAQGVMMVHSKSAPVDFDFLASIAESCGATPELLDEVRGANTASLVGDLMLAAGHEDFFEKLCRHASRHSLDEVGGGLLVETVLTTMKGELLGRGGIDERDSCDRNRG